MTLWRIEVLHPALVHFPIALLMVSFLAKTGLHLVKRPSWRQFLFNIFIFGLVVGTCTAWLAVWSGDQAHDIVNRVICDPEATHRHEELGEWTTWLFSAACVIQLASMTPRMAQAALRYSDWVAGTVTVIMAAGAMSLVRTGHSGAELVYLQGAGVHNYESDCKEFE